MNRPFIFQFLACLSFLLLLFSPAAMAILEARPLATDPRFRVVAYAPNMVYIYKGHYRYQSSIEFAPDEKIGTISMGDSTGWQITPSGYRIFLKPVERDATTNMTVITDRRVYHFELYAEEATGIRDPNLVFVMKFVYPEQDFSTVRKYNAMAAPDLQENPGRYNFNYTIAGAENVAPLRIFDDGEFTYFQFKNKNAEIPTFFQVDAEGSESLINYRVVKDYIVVERVSHQFTLRAGSDVVCVFNETMPHKRPEKKKRFLFF